MLPDKPLLKIFSSNFTHQFLFSMNTDIAKTLGKEHPAKVESS